MQPVCNQHVTNTEPPQEPLELGRLRAEVAQLNAALEAQRRELESAQAMARRAEAELTISRAEVTISRGGADGGTRAGEAGGGASGAAADGPTSPGPSPCAQPPISTKAYGQAGAALRLGHAQEGDGDAAAFAHRSLANAARQSGYSAQAARDAWSQITWFGLQAFGFAPCSPGLWLRTPSRP